MPYVIAFHTERPISAQAVRTLYDTAGWWPDRSLDLITEVLNRDLAIGAWQGNQLIAFARAITDGHFRAYIEDVIVHPDYRHQGIALQLLTHLVKRLAHIETISLFCTPELIGLYGRAGFRAHNTQVVMHRAGRKSFSTSAGEQRPSERLG